MHQLAYLTPKRAVAWKCLSLEATNPHSTRRLAPVAYASRSKRFFPGAEGQRWPGVLWVVSQPVYKHPNQAEVLFPPTLTAKLEVDRVVSGDTVRRWTDCELDRDLRIPRRHDKRQRWREASSVPDPVDRAIFRVTRSFARLAFRERRDSGLTQEDAWASVRTAIANRHDSGFFAHVDAERCLTTALGLPVGVKVGTRLQSPLQLRSDDAVAELQELANIGSTRSIFINYRWGARPTAVLDLAKALLSLRCGVWLDGLAIPHYTETPMFSGDGRRQNMEPSQVSLERLLHAGIDASVLFLCLAAGNYLEPRAGDPKGAKNWAVQEYEHAKARARKTGTPEIRVINLGQAPDVITKENLGRVWTIDHKVTQLARKIAALLHRS